jgi:hypothetical protein
MSGRGGNNRKHRHRFSGRKEEPQKPPKKQTENILPEPKFEKKQEASHRLRWTAPVLPASPITTPNCPWCGKQIKDIATAISDKVSGNPVHFDCVLSRIVEMEQLETNDSVCYLGGGRFGIIHYNNPPDMRDFTVKKILEWEIKEKNYEWRRPISEYYSLT